MNRRRDLIWAAVTIASVLLSGTGVHHRTSEELAERDAAFAIVEAQMASLERRYERAARMVAACWKRCGVTPEELDEIRKGLEQP